MVTAARALPAPRYGDGVTPPGGTRLSGYGDQYVLPYGPRLASDEGAYRVFRNTTPGTGIAGHAAPTTLDNTKPFILLKNGAPANGKRAYLDYIRLLVTAVGTGGSLNYATHILDSGANFTSGGEDLVAVNPNGDEAIAHGLTTFKAGAIVATAGGDQRIVSHQMARSVIPVIRDTLLFKFGSEPAVSASPTEGTLELERVVHCPPVIIAPAQFYKLVLWRASQSAAASYEIEVGLWER